jgi:hypothetical protein
MAAILQDAIFRRTVGSTSVNYKIKMNPAMLSVLTNTNSGIHAWLGTDAADTSIEAYTDIDELARSKAGKRINIAGKDSNGRTRVRTLVVPADKVDTFFTTLEAGLTVGSVTYNEEHTPTRIIGYN